MQGLGIRFIANGSNLLPPPLALHLPPATAKGRSRFSAVHFSSRAEKTQLIKFYLSISQKIINNPPTPAPIVFIIRQFGIQWRVEWNRGDCGRKGSCFSPCDDNIQVLQWTWKVPLMRENAKTNVNIKQKLKKHSLRFLYKLSKENIFFSSLLHSLT